MRAAEDRIGQILGGKYRTERLLAAGGMGFVYAARHAVTGRAVAIKLLRPELVSRPDLVERVSREARLAVDATHPNVVEVLDAGADEAGMPYLVLERLYGHALEALLDRPLSLRCTLEALVPVGNALAALHQAGIVHRDLKPSNIFLSEEGGRVTPKLLDFGIAKVLATTGSTSTGVTLGTPAYMAPEQLLCSVASPASDVWSLAVVYVRCLTGRLPFVDLAQRGLLAFGSGVRPTELDGVPEPIARVLAAALRFEAAERPGNAGLFRTQLLAALRELEPGQSWPDASSIGFAEHESELGSALKGAAAATGTERSSRAAPGRPRDVLTRTLSHAWQSLWLRRPRRQRAFALLLAVGVLALAQWGPAARVYAPVSTPESPRATSLALRAAGPAVSTTLLPVETATSAATAAAPASALTNPLPATPARTERERAGPSPTRSLSSASASASA
ncbi:MAG TPA: serine/threonine-protein kinase, partial [Polyangiaceae bacterium]|nr:serine/threonine-protein kinase [Polyangiaceae bacterium]